MNIEILQYRYIAEVVNENEGFVDLRTMATIK